jgi:VanZ family protein
VSLFWLSFRCCPRKPWCEPEFPGQLEHFVAYAGSASIAIAGYGRRGAVWIVGLFWIYAGVLKYLQHFSTGRHPSIAEFAASALAAFFGGLTRSPRALPVEAQIFGPRLI